MLPNIFLFVIAFFLLPSPVSAQGVEISPAFIEVTLEEAGEEKEIEITLRNTTDNPQLFALSAVDFRQADEFGKISFVGQDSGYSYSLASFLSFPSREVEIAPNSSEIVSVTVSNRQDLSPGGHYAAVVARLVQEEKVENESMVSPSLSSLILLRKTNGARFALSLASSSWPNSSFVFNQPRQIELLFQNEGNIHVIPYGRVEVKDMFGRLVMDGTVNPSSHRILPQSRRRIDAVLSPLEMVSPVSLMTMTINGQDSLKEASYTYQETFLYINPWVVMIPLIGGGVWVVWKKRRKK